MPGLLNQNRGGLLGGGFNPIRQIATGGTPGQGGTPFMSMGGGASGGDPNQYGSDAWALQGGGPGALFFRQLMRGMIGKNGQMNYNIFDPAKAGNFFSPETIGILRPEFQAGYKKAGK